MAGAQSLADRASDQRLGEAVWDWLDDGLGRRSDVAVTGRLGDYRTVQAVVRDGKGWLVTAPLSERPPASARETTAAMLARALAERMKAAFASPHIGRPTHRRYLWGQATGAAFSLLLVMLPLVAALFAASWILSTFEPPGWLRRELGYGVVALASFAALMAIASALLGPLFSIVGTLKQTAAVRRDRKDAAFFAAASPLSSGAERALTTRQIENIGSCLTARAERLQRLMLRAQAGGYGRLGGAGLVWWRDLGGRQRYRRLFGRASPALRLLLLPRATTLLAPRQRFDEALGSWFIGLLALGLLLAFLLLYTPIRMALPQAILVVAAAGGLAGAAVVLALSSARAKVRRRWRERAEQRRKALLETCDRILDGRPTDLSANGRRMRWLERMRAYA